MSAPKRALDDLLAPGGMGADKAHQRLFTFPARPERREHGMPMNEAELREFFKDQPAALERALKRLGNAPMRAEDAPRTRGRYWRAQCPRHLWPAVHDALKRSQVAFTTGMSNGSVDLLVTPKGRSVLEGFDVPAEGRASDPWPGRLEARAAAEAFRNAKTADATDPLEAAFRRYAAEVRARLREGTA